MLQIMSVEYPKDRFVDVRYVVGVEKVRDIEKRVNEAYLAGNVIQPKRSLVVESIEISRLDYDVFSQEVLYEYKWLAGKGGVNEDGLVMAIELVADNYPSLYINPDGENYAKYIGYAV